MAAITVKYDPTLKIEEIEEPMYATSEEESEKDKPAEVQQTKITGILSPLIKVNNILILWDKVTRFELASTGILPTLNFTFKDDLGFTKSLDQPGNDNLVLVQILPPFEDAYKKINLRFFIDDVQISGEKVTISAIYNVPGLYQDKLESLGKLTTYNLLDKIAKDCELGLASNIEGTEDERYVYIKNANYLDTLRKEIQISGDSEHCILDTWIDLHNYVVLCNMYDRYNEIEDDIKVWSMPSNIPDTNNDGKPIEPIELDAELTNLNGAITTQLYINDYKVNTASGSNLYAGTDKVIQTYYMNKREPSSVLVQDGDVKKDTFVKTYYMGEVFGEYDYYASKICRNAYLQKINANTIEVSLATPLLGLERGGKINVKWYECNEITAVIKDENEIETNTPDDPNEINDKTNWTLNKQVSGQYLIIGTTIKFAGWQKGWKYVLTLARPVDQVNTYLGGEEENG